MFFKVTWDNGTKRAYYDSDSITTVEPIDEGKFNKDTGEPIVACRITFLDDGKMILLGVTAEDVVGQLNDPTALVGPFKLRPGGAYLSKLFNEEPSPTFEYSGFRPTDG